MVMVCTVCKTTVVDGECECREVVEIVLADPAIAITGLVERHGFWPVIKAVLTRIINP